MNVGQKKKFKQDVTKTPLKLVPEQGRTQQEKEANYAAIFDRLQALKINTTQKDIDDAVEILVALNKWKALETAAPAKDNGAAAKLKALQGDSSGVSTESHGVFVQLDVDQLKHQHPDVPIGSRQKGGGNKFVKKCDATWHVSTTLEHMAVWAAALQMQEGGKVEHGQSKPVDGIHYEGYCILAGGKKYVSFHCYPADNNKQLLLA